MLFFLALVLDFFLAASGALVPDRVSRIKESIDAPPAGWTRIDRAPPHLSVRLRIALMQGQFDELERRLYEISDPDHARYGAHMTKQDVESLVRPRSTTLALVDEWLATFGFNTTTLDRSPAEDWVTLTVPVLILEQMLDTEYFIWRHDDGELLARTTSYSLPGYLHEHVELIQPTTMFARSPKRVARPAEDKHAVDSDCGTMITLACLRQLYSADGYTPRAPKKNAIGITGFLDQYANHKDLASFYRDQLPEAEGSSFRFVSVNGGANNQSLSAAGEEANLDVQYALGLAYPTPGTFWSTAGNGPFHPDARVHDPDNEPYMTWLDHVLRSDRLPQTITTSYADDEQTVPSAYARRVCKRFAELGCRGVSVIFASGDYGVGDGDPEAESQQCLSTTRHRTRFIPAFPASCPYVTAVGGTMGIPEVAAAFSGGGFSDYFERPAYQHKAVERYLHKLPPKTYEGLFNRGGRGIPDVSAQSHKFSIYWQGSPITIGGTSASAPTFAGIVALLNDARLARGRPALGFLNPLLYKRGVHALNDIVEGRNPGCGTGGFNATEGWDPVTGLGTPNFRELLKVVL